MYRLQANIKSILVPFVLLMLVAFLSNILYTQGVQRIKTYYANYNDLVNENNTLKTKLDNLRALNTGKLEKTNRVVLALTEEDPSVLVLANIRQISSEYMAEISDIRLTSNEGASDDTADKISKSTIDFKMVFQDLEQVNKVINDFSLYLPLVTIKNAKLTESPDGIMADMSVECYWSPLPSTLPALTDPVLGLNDSESKLFDRIVSLKVRDGTNITPNINENRKNPFTD